MNTPKLIQVQVAALGYRAACEKCEDGEYEFLTEDKEHSCFIHRCNKCEDLAQFPQQYPMVVLMPADKKDGKIVVAE